MEQRDQHSPQPPTTDAPPPRSTSFPQHPDEFDADPRVSFSKADGKFILEADDGQEYGFDEALRRWVLVLDEALAERQQAAYAVVGVDEAEPAGATMAAERRKRKKVYVNGEEDTGGRTTSKKAKANAAAEPRERKNTAVYVTSLPADVSVEEVHGVFSRCGVVAEEIDQGRPRIKLYVDEEGKCKGDALVVYFRAESVELAMQMLDDTEFRLGEGGPAGRMRVVAADFSYKTQKEAPVKGNGRDKRKIMKKTQRLNSKLADWDDDDPQAGLDTSSRWDKVVILKHMFTQAELEADPAAILDIKEDIREECSKLGEVTNVVLFDKELDGVASVRYSNAEAAKACVRLMDGRFFSGTKVEAYIADGNEKFKKSSNQKVSVEENGAEGDDESKRLDKFGSWLEEEGKEAEAEA